MKNKKLFYALLVIVGISISNCNDKSEDASDKVIWTPLLSSHGMGGYIKMNDSIYGLWVSDSTLYNKMADFYRAMRDVDVKSFRVCGESGYAKDKNRVYYPLAVEFFDGEDFGGEYMYEYVIKGADAKTFKYIGNGYAVDRNHMYFEGEIIPWDDSKIHINTD